MGQYKRKLKDGIKWRFKLYVKGGGWHSSPAIYNTKEEAAAAEVTFRASLKPETLEALMVKREQFLRTRDSSKKYLEENAFVFEQAKKMWGVNTPVTSITKAMAYDFVASEAERKPQNRNTKKTTKTHHPVNHAIRVLRAFFNYCIDVQDIEMPNPFHKMKLLPTGTDERKYIPEDSEIEFVRESLLRPEAPLTDIAIYIKDDAMRPPALNRKSPMEVNLLDFVDETGCRINEALRLRVEHVEEKVVTLYTRKSKNSNLTPRLIPRPSCLTDEVLESAEDSKDGRVFHRWTTRPRFLERKIFEIKYGKAKLKERHDGALVGAYPIPWNWHSLRHRRASIWAHEGLATYKIMERLGHNNLSTTMGYLQSLGIVSR